MDARPRRDEESVISADGSRRLSQAWIAAEAALPHDWMITGLVGGPSRAAQDVIAGVGPQTELAGKVVCFTGESVCSLHGMPLTREDQQHLARWAGLVVKTGVSKKLDILVMADPDSQSGKARKAAELGVRRVAEPVFWRMANVPVD